MCPFSSPQVEDLKALLQKDRGHLEGEKREETLHEELPIKKVNDKESTWVNAAVFSFPIQLKAFLWIQSVKCALLI